MKRIILLLLILSSVKAVFSQSEETITLSDALKQKLIVVSGKYNENSVHYLKPVVVTVFLNTTKAFRLKIESGDLFEPQDSTCQTMMITGDLIVLLKAKQPNIIEPFAMCVEPHDAAGRSGLKYFWKTNKNQKLVQMARYIDKHKENNASGQDAVWAIAETDKNILDINGYDSISRIGLIREVAKIRGVAIPNADALRQSYTNYTAPVMTETIGGMFEFSFYKTTKVHIGMFNSQGILVRELYSNPDEKPGVHKIKFEYDYSVYTDAHYDIKLIANDEVLLSSKVDRDDSNWEERR